MRRMLPTNRRASALFATSLVALSILIVSLGVGGEAKSEGPQPLLQVAGSGVQDVVWTNLTNATATGNNIQHSGSGYFAKGQSQQTISGAGYFEWTFDGDDCSVGYGNNNDETASAGYLDLDFAFELHPQAYGIRERGVYRAEGVVAAGDVLRIEIAGNGDVLYKKNGAIVYTTTNPTKAFPYYLVFKTQETAGNSISGAKVQAGAAPTPTPTPGPGVQDVIWTNLIAATATGSSIQHNGSGYFAQGQSQQTISGPGYFEWTFDGDDCSVGFGNNNDETPSAGYLDLDFAFELHPQSYGIRERGVYRAEGTAAAGNVFRIEIAGNGDVLYKKNGAIVFTTINPTKAFPYYLVFKAQEVAGFSISAAKVQAGAAPSPTPTPTPTPTPGPGVQDVIWTNLIAATATGSSIQHNGSGYFAQGQSQQTISGPGYFEWTFDGDDCSVGYGNNNDESPSAGYLDLDFAFELHPQAYGIRERGVYRSEGVVAAGDVLRIEIAGNGDVLYKKNGAIVYTTTNPSKAFPYYLVFKTQEVAGFSISNAKVQAGSSATFNNVPVASGIPNPTAMAFAPDGRLFVCQQNGQLRVITSAGALLPDPFVTLTVNSSGERGLLGVAFDPNFASNQWVYVYYTATTPTIHNRVSRFTAAGNVAVAGSEVPILDLDNLSAATNHNGGAIHFGPDNKLYIAVGENANPANSQSVGNLLGKILRINSDGTIPSDNPTTFPGIAGSPSGKNRAIWSVGLRNPYTFDFQPGSGRMFINDVGETAWEEINDGIAGSNYGWSICEGACSPPNANFRDPLFQYGHGTGETTGCAITGGAFYNPAIVTYPSDYVGKYFYAEFCSGWIRRFDPATSTSQPFASGLSSPVDLKVGPDGNLYYLVRGGGAVFKIIFR
jgi:glucose/arabinose dehydrogenase